jgi:pimeloyl-ACP methyl ester carboxylesterase
MIFAAQLCLAGAVPLLAQTSPLLPSQKAPLSNRVVAAFIASLFAVPSFADSAKSQVVERELRSKSLENTKVGTNPVRKMAIYLPTGYDESSKRYPVIYFLPNHFEGTYRFVFDERNAQGIFDRAIAAAAIDKFILVCVDMTTPLGNSWSVNSSVTGNWDDFVVKELVPYIDANFKTLPNRNSRGIAGVFMGGYGAIRLSMRHPDVFGSVYGLHPVGTGSGIQIMDSLPKWDLLASAKSMDDVKKDSYSWIFATIFQAHLPNPDKPPLFIDLAAHREGEKLIIDPKLTERLRNNFFLESMIPEFAENLKSLRGFKFDWARSDLNQDHVYSNLAFTHKLNEFGIAHEAEEYNGAWGEPNWGDEGRIYTQVLPFFQRHLVFEGNDNGGR